MKVHHVLGGLLAVLVVVVPAGAAELYGVSYETHALYTINTDTGIAVEVGPLGANFTEGGLAQLPDGTLYAAISGDPRVDPKSNSLYQIDLDASPGHATWVSAFGEQYRDVSGLEYVPTDGLLYGLDADAGLFRMNITEHGVTTEFVGSTGQYLGRVAGLAYRNANGLLYGTDSATDALYTLDLDTGLASLVGRLHGVSPGIRLDKPSGMAFVGEDLFIVDGGIGGTNTLSRVDPNTGTLLSTELITLATGATVEGIGGLTAVIPEPATLTLLAVAALALRRRRQ